jgi:hypothetical protein
MKIESNKYSPKELEEIFDNHGRDFLEGSIPHKVFEEIKRRVDIGIPISYTESRYFHLVVNLVVGRIYGIAEDYEVCKEHIFMKLYHTYAPDNLGCELNATDEYHNLIPLEQRLKDGLKINSILDNWIATLNSPITDSKIQSIKDEVDKDIANLNSLNLLYGVNYIKAQQRKLYLRAKFVYNTVLGILDFTGETINVGALTFTIKFHPKSLIHILYRHYGQIMKPSLLINEDYFTEDIHYENLGSVIEKFLKTIFNSGLVKPKSDDVINIKYKNTIYIIVIRKSTIITFYPVSKSSKLHNLATQYNLYQIDMDLFLYVKKINIT